ncbi:MAG: LPS export ABC transporter permease LptF [Pseudomonadota bacterium]
MIVDRYITRHIASPMLLIIGLFVALFVTYSLTRFLTDAATGLLSMSEVLRITALRGIIALEVLIPISLYVAIVVGLGQLYSDSEMDALRSAGLSRPRLMRPIVALALVVALVTAVGSLVVRPWAYASIYQLKAEAEASDELERIKPGQFYHYEDQDRTVYVRARGQQAGDLRGIFVRTRVADRVEVIASARGHVEEFVTPTDHELQLENARVFRIEDGEFDVVGEFSALRLTLAAAVPQRPPYKAKSATSAVLAQSTVGDDQAEYQWRLSTGLSVMLLALLAIPLSHSLPRQGRYSKVMIAVGVYAVYYILIGMARTWVEQERLSSIFWVPALLTAAVVVAYKPWRGGKL